MPVNALRHTLRMRILVRGLCDIRRKPPLSKSAEPECASR